MFGFSLAELVVVFLVALIFIKPQDLPEIAYFCGKLFYKGKKLFQEAKNQFKEIQKEAGIQELKDEINRAIAEEKSKFEDEKTVIVDLYGNEHVVSNISQIRSDKEKEDLEEEVKKLNEENSSKKNSDQKDSNSVIY